MILMTATQLLLFISESGIDEAQSEVSHRVIQTCWFHEWINRSWRPCFGHGTYVAGVLASKSYGVAKEANLIDVKGIQKNGKSKIIISSEGIIIDLGWIHSKKA